MKNLALLFVLIFGISGVACSQGAPKSPRVTAESGDVSVSYGQPSKRGRVVFGKEGSGGLETYGKVWRTGANEATTITFKKDGKFGGKDVKAGTYGLFTIPGEKEWTVILNSEPKQWGAYSYKADKDVLRVNVPAMAMKEPTEALTFKVSNKSLDFMWDTAMFSVPLAF